MADAIAASLHYLSIFVLFALLNFWLTSRIANSGTDAPRRRGRPGRKVAPCRPR